MSIAEILDRWQIKCLYHVTPTSNMDSILEHGIYSMAQLKSRNIRVSQFMSSDDSRKRDQQFASDDFVRLSLVNDHLMIDNALKADRRIALVNIMVHQSVLLIPGAQFATGPTNTNRKLFPIDELDKHMPLDNMYVKLPAINHGNALRSKPLLRYGEIVIPKHIPRRYLVASASIPSWL